MKEKQSQTKISFSIFLDNKHLFSVKMLFLI